MPPNPALPKGANGALILPRRAMGLFPQSTIVGGPFRHVPGGMSGVCLLEQMPALPGYLPRQQPELARIHMPIEDFSVPHDPAAVEAALRFVFMQLLLGQKVYVGCMGGWGRTGLFLALVAKVAGEADPVRYVRSNYTPRAVETPEQHDFVAKYDVAPIRRWLAWQMLRHLPYRLRGSSRAQSKS